MVVNRSKLFDPRKKVIQLTQSETPNDSMERGDVFMVFPYMDHDLCGLLANPAFRVNISVMKTLLQQLLEGLVYIHSVNFSSC